MLESLLSGLIAAMIVLVAERGIAGWRRRERIRGYWGALFAEVEECGTRARTYLDDGVMAPLYRLPTVCYENSLPSLFSDAAVDDVQTTVLLKFYAEVQTLNRGLDLADEHRSDESILPVEYGRNRLKADRIAAPSGSFYAAAREVCEKGKAPGWLSRILRFGGT